MSKIVWDKTGERIYETGVDHVVVYPQKNGAYPKGVAWNGASSIAENPSGAEPNDIWADNIKYLTLMSAEELDLSIEAYMYPDEFAELDGTAEVHAGVSIGQQTRKPFGLCYRTIEGNDEEENDYGYKLHLVYNCKASPSEKSYQTINDSPEAISFSWSVNTLPAVLTTINPATEKPYKPTALVIIDSTKVDPEKLKAFEAILYGTDADGSTPATDPSLPLPDEVLSFFA